MEKDKKKGVWKARIIALGVALLMLAAATGVTLWQYFKSKEAYLSFDLTTMLIINGVGFVLLYFIVCHFVKKSILSEEKFK